MAREEKDLLRQSVISVVGPPNATVGTGARAVDVRAWAGLGSTVARVVRRKIERRVSEVRGMLKDFIVRRWSRVAFVFL